MPGLVHRCQRDVGEGSDEGVVVAYDRYVVGHAQPGGFEGAEGASGEEIVEGEECGWERVALDERAHRRGSIEFVVAAVKDAGFQSG